MGTAGLKPVGQIDHLFDGLEVSREENDPPGLYFLMNEARSGVIDVPTNPTMNSCPIFSRKVMRCCSNVREPRKNY